MIALGTLAGLHEYRHRLAACDFVERHEDVAARAVGRQPNFESLDPTPA
jgi:hypothetical protein